MKIAELVDRDFTLIKSMAHSIWIDRAIRDDNHNIRCILEAYLLYMKSKGYSLTEDNKINEQKGHNS